MPNELGVSHRAGLTWPWACALQAERNPF